MAMAETGPSGTAATRRERPRRIPALSLWVFNLAMATLWPAHAAVTLRGLLVLNQERGQPVAGAAVSASGANPTVSASDGSFTLTFPQGLARRLHPARGAP